MRFSDLGIQYFYSFFKLFWLNPCFGLESYSVFRYICFERKRNRMKKTLLSLFAIAGFSVLASAQIEMYADGGTTDYAGGGIYSVLATDDSELIVDMHVENHTGSTHTWIVSRTRINRPTSWADFLCWGHETDQFGGTCFSAVGMDSDPWSCLQTNAVTVADGEAGIIAAHITPSFNDPAVVTYRYYVGVDGDPFQDSMDVEVSLSPASIADVAPSLAVSVSPNPASDYVNITAEGVDGATVRIMDVLGNKIMTSKIVGSKTIDVSEYRNGIYFIIVESRGVKTVNRKVIIRH